MASPAEDNLPWKESAVLSMSPVLKIGAPGLVRRGYGNPVKVLENDCLFPAGMPLFRNLASMSPWDRKPMASFIKRINTL
jgi:hypothetical protein